MGVLEVSVRTNFAGTENARLYSESFFGTKRLIEAYVTEVEAALAFVRKSPDVSIDEKRRFFKSLNRNLGSSALCLSGGASFGYYHIGLIRALLDANLLPRVIAGTSAGGIIAALVCTRSDEELRRLLTPRLADNISACEEPFRQWFARLRQTGARFDPVKWARKACFFTKGSLTFREAYELTGRVLNISVIPFDQHSPTKLLNYLTAPHCVIWSAVLASAAVPGILPPVVLLQKTRTGDILPWNWGSLFKDGSLRVDIPLQSLNLLFNVNYPIVSQVNPHVHLFFFAPRGSAGRPVAHRKGKGWRGGFVLSAAEQYLKLDLSKTLKVIRDLELLPTLLGQDWSSVFLQRFDGVVTIWPKTRFKDWLRILSDPDRQELERMIQVGQIVTWPKLHMIENRARLEQEVLKGRISVRRALRSREKSRVMMFEPTPGSGTAAGSSDPGDTDTPTLPNSSPPQLPVESDAEAGFAKGEEKFFNKKRPKPAAARPEPLTLAAARPADTETSQHLRRRSWSQTLFMPTLSRETYATSTQQAGDPSTGFLSRLKRGAASTLSLSSFRKPVYRTSANASGSLENEEIWSSDSSSEYEYIDGEQALGRAWTTGSNASPTVPNW